MVLHGIVLVEDGHTLVEQVVLVVVDKGSADTQAFLTASCGNEADGTHTIVHQFVSQLSTRHSRIANGEIEAISDGVAQVVVIDDVEAVTLEDLFQSPCPLAIDSNL